MNTDAATSNKTTEQNARIPCNSVVLKICNSSWMWWYIPVIKRQRQEDQEEVKDSLDNIVKSYLKTPEKNILTLSK
jgi:hypothetical protein